MARDKDKKGAPAAPAAPEPETPAEAAASGTEEVAPAAPPPSAPVAPAVDLTGRFRVLRRAVLGLPGQGLVVLRPGAEVSAESHGDRAMAAIIEAGVQLERLPD